MLYIVIFAAAVLFYLSVTVRVIAGNPLKVLYNASRDIYKWLRYFRWREGKMGNLIAFVGLFGKGKTLSAVHFIVTKYRKYNNRRIYDFARRKWVTQKVHVISNVNLSGIPYEHFSGLVQVIQAAQQYKVLDQENDTLTLIYILGDEFSVQLNSRKFKENIDPLFLNTLLTCRHHHISLVYTSQRFNHVDALLRQVTSYVVSCNKVWRCMVHRQYDAYQLENATDPLLIKPIRRFGWFIENKDYNAYDTLACVDNLSKSCQEGDMLSEDEILALQCNNGVQMEGVVDTSRKYRRKIRKERK
ncbi:hypothetical protein IMSAGC003_00399 [Lachnospiraceae bacterium]|nr:hypothetical protein IMSAGC003_00399 [Lachnospiraceae bacterium]